MSWLRYATGAAASCLLLASCGTGSSSISSGAGNTLRADVLALTRAVAGHQWSAADQALAQLRTDLNAAAAANAVSAERAQAIHLDVQHVAADLAARREAATPTTSSSSSTHPKPAPPPPPPPHHGHGDKPGHGHGHGEGG